MRVVDLGLAFHELVREVLIDRLDHALRSEEATEAFGDRWPVAVVQHWCDFTAPVRIEHGGGVVYFLEFLD